MLPSLDSLSSESLAAALAPYDWAAEVLGILGGAPAADHSTLGAAVQVVLAARARARGRSDFAEADRIRSELADAGIVIEDDGTATRWHLAGPDR